MVGLKQVGIAVHALGVIVGFAAAGPLPLPDSTSQTHPERPSPEHLVKISVGLKLDTSHGLEAALLSVSDPSHEHFGLHLSREEAKALLQPHSESTREVRKWLSHVGVDESQIEDQGQFIHAKVAVGTLHKLLETGPDLSGRDLHAASRGWHTTVPLKVRRHIDFIHTSDWLEDVTPMGNTMYPKVYLDHSKRSAAGSSLDNATIAAGPKPRQCYGENTPGCLRQLYNIRDGALSPHAKSLLGIVGFSGQTVQYRELERFIGQFAPSANGTSFSVVSVNGGKNPQGEYPSGEANLDVQYAMAMAPGIPVRYYTTGGEMHDFIPDLDIVDRTIAHVEPFFEFAQYLLDLDDDELPQVVSISYSINEQVLPKAYAQQVCNMFGQLGTRGVSVIVASGDTGPGVSCQSNDGKNATKFLPAFPASCPYVTSVGGTQGTRPEAAAWFSSGGFSEYFSRPRWQAHEVGEFLRSHGQEWEGYFNRKGRGYPDVAAQAMGYPILNHGKVELADGTSASTPVFAALIARLNNCRFKRGKPALGFLNPWIYGTGQRGFLDITEGKSVGCEGLSWWGLPSPRVPNAGWRSVDGWDPATGMGTPLFEQLERLSCRSILEKIMQEEEGEVPQQPLR